MQQRRKAKQDTLKSLSGKANLGCDFKNSTQIPLSWGDGESSNGKEQTESNSKI